MISKPSGVSIAASAIAGLHVATALDLDRDLAVEQAAFSKKRKT
jgi:hypothetical protein